jgi:hypothetical protein
MTDKLGMVITIMQQVDKMKKLTAKTAQPLPPTKPNSFIVASSSTALSTASASAPRPPLPNNLTKSNSKPTIPVTNQQRRQAPPSPITPSTRPAFRFSANDLIQRGETLNKIENKETI